MIYQLTFTVFHYDYKGVMAEEALFIRNDVGMVKIF